MCNMEERVFAAIQLRKTKDIHFQTDFFFSFFHACQHQRFSSRVLISRLRAARRIKKRFDYY